MIYAIKGFGCVQITYKLGWSFAYSFRTLVRKRQRAHMSGDIDQARILRNKVNHTASKLRHEFYQTHIASLTGAGSHDWWKHMKTIMGHKTSGKSSMQGVAVKIANGDYGILADIE